MLSSNIINTEFSKNGIRLVIGHLYPGLMNLYGDRGNVICLRERCHRRGIGVEVREIEAGEELDPEAYDILFLGGGQDKEQRLVAEDLAKVKGRAIREAVEREVVALAICGGYQLFGKYYRPAQGLELPGIGLFDIETIHKGIRVPRCIGNIVVKWQTSTLVGFENHGGRTYLGKNAQPLGRVLQGHGNNSEDGTEGAVYKNAFGTYLHGCLLSKNPYFADHLIGLALSRRYGNMALPLLDDRLEKRAHERALRQARKPFWALLGRV